MADEGEDAAQRVAVGRVAGVTDVQRPGGVDAHELHVHLLPRGRRQRVAAVVGALGEQPVQSAPVPGVGQEEIEKAGAGDLEAVADAGPRAGQPAGAERLGQLSRRAAGRLGADERRVGGDVAVLGPRRQRELDGRCRSGGAPAAASSSSSALCSEAARPFRS